MSALSALLEFISACREIGYGDIRYHLRRGVGPNQVITDESNGYQCTPLHLLLDAKAISKHDIERKPKAVKILIQHGADANAQDSMTNTPLHKAATHETSRLKIIHMLISAGAKINVVNMYGETPFEILLKNNPKPEEIRYFREVGISLNNWNIISQQGYAALAMKNEIIRNYDILKIIGSVVGTLHQTSGRNFIQNVVSANKDMQIQNVIHYGRIIRSLMRLGCDIDNLDESGMTALDIALKFENKEAAEALMRCGCTVNVNSPAMSLFPPFKTGNLDKFMRQLGIHDKTKQELHNCSGQSCLSIPHFWRRVEETKILPVGSKTLVQFLSETDIVMNYWNLPVRERQAIDTYFEQFVFSEKYYIDGSLFESVRDRDCSEEIQIILRLQYSRAVCRKQILQSALDLFDSLVPFQMPFLCKHAILQYLPYWDLKIFIIAAKRY